MMSFICPEIAQFIENEKTVYSKTGTGTCKSHSFSFEIRLDSDNSNLFDFVAAMIHWVSALKWSSPIDTLLVRLHLTPFDKTWCPSTDHQITKCNINSGETAFRSARRNIQIWRREDYHKVLLHELLHAFNWDRLVSNDDKNSEAVVEAVAFLLHCQLLTGSGKTQNEFWNNERKWQAYQVDLLLNHDYKWKPTETNVYEYIVVKSAFTINDSLLTKFKKWLSLPTVKDCNDQWANLLSENLNELKRLNLKSIHQREVNSNCVSMALVYHQLSTNPMRM